MKKNIHLSEKKSDMLTLRNLALATTRTIYRSFSIAMFRVMAEKQLFLTIFKNRFMNNRGFDGRDF